MILEAPTILRMASKEDLFTGEINNLKGKQGVKDCVTLFYYNKITAVLSGPFINYSENDFVETYHNYVSGLIGVIAPFPNVITNEYVFDLVLREGCSYDVKYSDFHLKINRIFYTYADKKLLGPFFIDRSTTSSYLENLIAKNQLFVPNERQHFKNKSLQKTG